MLAEKQCNLALQRFKEWKRNKREKDWDHLPSTRPGVWVTGGSIIETWMLSTMTSCCNDSANPRSPNFVAEYAA